LIVGGGPAGLQAAIAAARNGHSVTVCEREPLVGGQVRLAASIPNRAEFGDLVRNLESEARRLGVRIETGIAMSADSVLERGADEVVVATGSTPARPWWAPEDPQVVDIRDVVDGTVTPEGTVTVIDELGFHQATSVAELLADRGCTVEIITPGMVVGQDLGITLDLETWWIRASAKGIVQSTELVPVGWSEGAIQLQHHPTGQMAERRSDWTVLAVPPSPADALFFELAERGCSVQRVGDALAPRRAHAAIIDGERVGSSL
jgi:2,4-dienoyl-CoA reductase (NADPH2)